jgi:protein phosphatase
VQREVRYIKNRLKKRKDLSQGVLYCLLFSSDDIAVSDWQELLITLSREIKELHRQERNESILNKFVYKVESDNDFVVIGDIHGDINSFWEIVEREELLKNWNKKTILLGDYIDRGPYQISTLFLALYLKYLKRRNVYLLRGNHEQFVKSETDYKPVTHGGDELFVNKYRESFNRGTFDALYDLFEDLPGVIVLNGTIGLAHSGIPRPTDQLNQYNFITILDDLNDDKILYEMRWSMPENKEDVIVTGESRFSTALCHFKNFTSRLGWEIIIRGHDPVSDGYETLPIYGNRIITIHSTGCDPKTLKTENPGENTDFPYVDPAYIRLKKGRIEVVKVYGRKVVRIISFGPKEERIEF